MTNPSINLIYEALSKPHALLILKILYEKGVATLTDIMVELKTLSKYRSIKNTVEHLIGVGLIKKEVREKGAVKSWKLTLTQAGKGLIEIIHREISARFPIEKEQ